MTRQSAPAGLGVGAPSVAASAARCSVRLWARRMPRPSRKLDDRDAAQRERERPEPVERQVEQRQQHHLEDPVVGDEERPRRVRHGRARVAGDGRREGSRRNAVRRLRRGARRRPRAPPGRAPRHRAPVRRRARSRSTASAATRRATRRLPPRSSNGARPPSRPWPISADPGFGAHRHGAATRRDRGPDRLGRRGRAAQRRVDDLERRDAAGSAGRGTGPGRRAAPRPGPPGARRAATTGRRPRPGSGPRR